MAWQDSPWYEPCERDWQVGQFYKLRAVYGEHERYGPQLTEMQAIRPVNDADRADGFDPLLVRRAFALRRRGHVHGVEGHWRPATSPMSRCAAWC